MSGKASWMSDSYTDHEGMSRFLVRLFRSGVIGWGVSQRAAGANMSVDIAVGDGLIAKADMGPWAWTDAVTNVSLDPASAQDRIDAIVGFIDYSVSNPSVDNPNDPGALKWIAVKGTPAGSPTAPNTAAIQAAIGDASYPYVVKATVLVKSTDSVVTDARITNYSLPIASAFQYFYSGNLNTIGHFLPNVADDTFALLNAAQTFTNKTFTSPVINTPTIKNWDGWQPLSVTPDTVTYNGNRSYDLTFSGAGLFFLLSKGMRLKLTRTVAAPPKCTSLDGSTQFYSKSSPSAMNITDNFTSIAWVKLSAYTTSAGQAIMARMNNSGAMTDGWKMYVDISGRVGMLIRNGGSGNFRFVTSQQSLPLNKWVHVAASWAGGTVTIYLDGISVPLTSVSTSGTAPTTAVATGDFTIGRGNSTEAEYFNGKIAQAAIFSSVLSASTVRSYASQALAGNEANLVSAYSFNNSINDLNTSNANNLTADGSAVATASDSPFAGGSQVDFVTGTVEIGIVMAKSASTNTALTVQVPEGYAIPTSGGVSAVSYSTDARPFGLPDASRWNVTGLWRTSVSQSSPVSGTWYNLGQSLTLPVGSWKPWYEADLDVANSVNFAALSYVTLSTGNNSESDPNATAHLRVDQVTISRIHIFRQLPSAITVASPTTYYLNLKSGNGGSSIGLASDQSPLHLVAECPYV